MAETRRNRAWLLATAKAVAVQLKAESTGTPLRVRIPHRAADTNTDGWNVIIGSLGKGKPKLEIWFDRFSGYPERKLFAGFRSESRAPLLSITKRVTETLWPARIVTPADTDEEKFLVLTQRIRRTEFNAPLLEKYADGETFFGIYDQTRETSERVNPHFCNRAVAFFDDVARTLPLALARDEDREIFPRCENRKLVASHLQRERSRLLATECKIRDNYECQVCGICFVDIYGDTLGSRFAEAHHVVPLSQLTGDVITSLADLQTVCANCHRMLHRMNGKRNDVDTLRKLVVKTKGRRVQKGAVRP